MKKYDYETRKWVDEEEFERLRNIRSEKSKFCKGKKPHDFVLILPWGATYNSNYKFQPEIYYEAMKRRKEFIEKQREELLRSGIVDKTWNSEPSKLYECSVCGKKLYKD